MTAWLLFVILCFVCQATLFEDTISSSEGFSFIGKFCFDRVNDDSSAGVGSLSLSVSSPNEYTDLKILMYDDEIDSWPSIFSGGKYSDISCEDKMEHAKNFHNGNTIHPRFNLDHTQGGPFIKDHIEVTEHIRPRFWFIAVANCASEGFQDLSYRLHFVNLEAPFPQSWNREFGFNEAGLNTFYLVFFLGYTLYLSMHFYGVWNLYLQHDYVHPLIRLFCAVLVCQYLSILFHTMHFLVFSENGYGTPSLTHLAEVLGVVSQLAFLLLLMLLARGWTILNEKMEANSHILSFVGLFAFLRLTVLLWKYGEENPANVKPSIFVDVLLWLEAGCWVVFAILFISTVLDSYRRSDDEKQQFLFKLLGGVYALWIAAPATFACWVIFLDPWVQFKISTELHLTYTCASHFFLSYLLWPSRVDAFFMIKVPDVFNSKIDYDGL